MNHVIETIKVFLHQLNTNNVSREFKAFFFGLFFIIVIALMSYGYNVTSLIPYLLALLGG